tara:strand:- start:29733 stop:30320 length:588 start_codon:yes stop_codon:yes gene_type:complete
MLDISNFPWAECSITENRTDYRADTLALRRKSRSTGVHRFEFELVTVEMELKIARGVKAKLSAATDETIVFTHPRLSYCQGTEPASKIQAFGVNSADSKLLSLTSIGAWQLLAGDYLQVDNDSKVYEVAEDTLLQVGNQIVTLTSPLRYSLTAATNIIVNDVTWHLLSNGVIETGGMQASDNQDMELTLVAVEKL